MLATTLDRPTFPTVERAPNVRDAIAATNPRHRPERGPSAWYTLSIVPPSRERICLRARDLGFTTYTPMSRTPPVVRKFGRKPVVEANVRPLMPGYVFVELPAANPRFDLFAPWDRENDRPAPLPRDAEAGYVADRARPSPEPIRGCLGFVGTSEGPRAVSGAVIEDMRLREKNGEFDLTGRSEDGRFVVPKWLRLGAWVELIDGPFRGFSGSIEEVLSAALVKVGVSIFGRNSPVAIPLDWIRMARSEDHGLLISRKNRAKG